MIHLSSVVSLFLLFNPSFTFQQHPPDWELRKNENGIAVYTRYAEGSDLKEVRVVSEVNSTLNGCVALIMDLKNYPNWIYACSEASVLSVVNSQERYQYQVTDVPWPVSDRDVVSYFKIGQDESTKIVTTTNSSDPGRIPEKEGRVRVQYFKTTYKLSPLPNGKVKVEFELYVDPGGNIPAWLINANIVTAPYKTTLAMMKQLTAYQTASLPFIKEK